MNNNSTNEKYSLEERLHNLEELIWSLFLSLALVGIISLYKFPFWLNIIFVSILVIICGNFSVRFFTIIEISALYWGNVTNNFIEKHRELVKFIVKWLTILTGIVISKILMRYDWKTTTGILLLSIIGNIITNYFLKLDKKKNDNQNNQSTEEIQNH